MTANTNEKVTTREKILEASLNLFSKNGFHATTTKKIAQKAGVNEVSLFRLFKSKLGLFQEILKLVKKTGFDPQKLSEITAPPQVAIRNVIDYMLEINDLHPREFKVLNRAAMDEVEGFEEWFVLTNLEQIQNFLVEKFKALQESGEMEKGMPPKMLSYLLLTQITGINMSRIILKKHPLRELDRTKLGDDIFNLFLGIHTTDNGSR
jgi:AcrR family transcriptional regulator